MITIQAGYALVVDDEPANRDFLERLLQTAGFKVTGAGTGADGLRAARSFPELAIALVDHELPDAKGLEIIKKLREENPESLLVMATMHDDRTLIDEAFDAGVDVFLVKPHGFMELYRRLQEVDANTSLLRKLVIDQYGPRPYRGADKRTSQAVVPSRSDEEVTRPATSLRTQALPVVSEVVPASDAKTVEPVNAIVNDSNPLDATQPNAAVSEPTLPSINKARETGTASEATLIHPPSSTASDTVKPSTPVAPSVSSVVSTPLEPSAPTVSPVVESLKPLAAPTATPTETNPEKLTVVQKADVAKADGQGEHDSVKDNDATIPRRPKVLGTDKS
jgi:CheY-like chemotaxis protein